MKYLFLFVTFFSSSVCFGQVVSIETDSKKNYVIKYVDDESDSLFSGIWVPGDLVKVFISSSVEYSETDKFKYSYRIVNNQESQVDLYEVNISTPNEPLKIFSNRGWFSRFVKWQGLVKWSHRSGPPYGIEPGSEDQFNFSSSDLPSIGVIQTANLKGTSFPKEKFEFPNSVETVLDSLNKEHGYVNTISIIPLDPSIWLGSNNNFNYGMIANALESYLKRSCEELSWITKKGICNSLEVKLKNVQKHLENEKPKQAVNVLKAFLNEVNAQKDKALSSEAYALLYFNGEYLLQKLNEEGK